MSTIGKVNKQLNNNKGITIVLVAILMFVLVGFVGLALDVSYMYVVKGQLQNAADAGALAGAAKLNEVYASYPCDPSSFIRNIKEEAKRIAEKNNAAGAPLTGAVEITDNANDPLTDDNDVTIGNWDPTKPIGEQYDDITPGLPKNAVLVRVRRTTESPLGQVGLFISRLMGWSTMGTAAEAVAVSEPAPILPIAVNEYWLDRQVMDRKDPYNPTWKPSADNVPYAKEVHAYPNSFVRDTPVGGSIYGTEKAYGKTFAILGGEANANIPSSEGGSQAITGYVNLDFRSSWHDGREGSWYQYQQGGNLASACAAPNYNFYPINPINQGDVDSTKYGASLVYLIKGYNYAPPNAVKEKYRSEYYLSNYDVSVQDAPNAPFATVAHFSASGETPLNKKYNEQRFNDVYHPGDKLVAMVYDGTFYTETAPNMPNAVTLVGYVLLQVDGFSSKPATSNMTNSDKKTVRDDFWQNGGTTAYAHAIAPIVEPSGSFTEYYTEISKLRWKGGKGRLVMHKGIF